MLAEKLLEGYNGFYSNTSSIDESVVCEYIQEACIQAISDIQEAAQQYYTADIIGQSQVLMEGSDAGGKAKQLWNAFIEKLKKVLKWFKEKIQKAIAAIRNFTSTEHAMKKRISKISKEPPNIVYEVPTAYIQSCKTSNDMMNAVYSAIDGYFNKPQLKALDDIDEFIKSIVIRIMENNGKPLEPATGLIIDVDNKKMTDQELIDELDRLEKPLYGAVDTVNITSKQLTDAVDLLQNNIDVSRKATNTVLNAYKYTVDRIPKATDPNTPKIIQDFIFKYKRDGVEDPNHTKEDMVVMAICKDLTTIINNISVITNSSTKVITAMRQHTVKLFKLPVQYNSK